MKALFLVMLSCLVIPEQGMAASSRKPSSEAKGPCEAYAHNLAGYMEQHGWIGAMVTFSASTVGKKQDDQDSYTYDVKVIRAASGHHDSLSNITYSISVTDRKEGHCAVTNVSTDTTDLAE